MINLLHTLRSRPQLVPRWVIFAIDLAICTVSLGLAYAIRFEFNPPLHDCRLPVCSSPASFWSGPSAC